MTTETFERVQQRLAKRLKISPQAIAPDSQIKELMPDSLEALELVFELETEFQIEIPVDRDIEWTTVSAMCDSLEELMAAADS